MWRRLGEPNQVDEMHSMWHEAKIVGETPRRLSRRFGTVYAHSDAPQS